MLKRLRRPRLRWEEGLEELDSSLVTEEVLHLLHVVSWYHFHDFTVNFWRAESRSQNLQVGRLFSDVIVQLGFGGLLFLTQSQQQITSGSERIQPIYGG